MHQSKITIAFIIDKLDAGGTEKQLVEMISYLNRENFDPFLISLRSSNSFLIEDLTCSHFVIDVYRLVSINGLINFIWLVRFLERTHVDIVQTYFVDSTIFGILAARIAKVKCIISSRRDLGFWRKPTLVRFLNVIARFVDRYLANSQAVKQDLVSVEGIPREKVDVIYNGLDSSNIEGGQLKDQVRELYKIPSNDKVIGIVANLNRPVKRVDLFIRAAACVLREAQEVSFMILGDGYLRHSLEELAYELNIRQKLIFAGLQTQIYSIMSVWDIGVNTSDSEGFANSIIEYMAIGLPVIATDVGGNKEIIDNGVTGILVPPGDHKLIAETSCHLLHDISKALRMGQAAKRLVHERYSWGKRIKEIETYYFSLLKNQCKAKPSG